MTKNHNKLFFRCAFNALVFINLLTTPLSLWAEQTELTMLMSWNGNHSAVVNIPLVYIDMVAAASDQDITISTKGPEVVSPFEQLRPVSTGAFDLLFSHGLYHTGTTWMGATMDSVASDVEKRRASGVWTWLDNYYSSEHNLKLLAIPSAATGFRFYLNQPIPADGDLSGKTIRSLHTHKRILAALSGTPVLLAPSDIYSAVEKSVIDGLIWTSVGARGFKFHEVAPYIVEPSFGNVSYLIFMNLDRFNQLSAEQQKILLDAGYQLEMKTVSRFQELLEEETAGMLEDGAKKIELGSLNQEEANRLFAEETWQTAIKYTGDKARQFHEFVLSAEM